VFSCVAERLQEKFVDTKRGNQKPEIEERQTTQWSKDKYTNGKFG
jgi:hypothetical protein